GEPLDQEAEYCIAHPERITRRFNGGITETVELPPDITGLRLTVNPGASKNVIVRFGFDFRRLDQEQNMTLTRDWDTKSNIITVGLEGVLNRTQSTDDYWGAVSYSPKRRMGLGCIAVIGSDKTEYHEYPIEKLVNYDLSRLMGRPAAANVYSPGEYQASGRGKFEFVLAWGEDKSRAVANARRIQTEKERWRKTRRSTNEQIISRLWLRCDNQTVEKAFAWSLLTLQGLRVHTDSETYFLTGLPFTPQPDGWHTALAVPGLIAAEFPSDTVRRALDYILKRQDKNPSSSSFGMLPGAVWEEQIDIRRQVSRLRARTGRQGGEDEKDFHITAEYRIPEIAGLAVRAWQRLQLADSRADTAAGDRFAAILARDLQGTASKRLKKGLVVDDSLNHFLGGGVGAPDRRGPVIESQALFGLVRDYLKRYPRLDEAAPDLPAALLTGESSLNVITSEMPLVVMSQSGEFETPATAATALSLFRDAGNFVWADRLVFNDSTERPTPVFEPRAAAVLALYWQNLLDRRRLELYLPQIVENGLVASAGLRSLASTAPDYQSAHFCSAEGEGIGAIANGDVLLWTGGILGDIYLTAGWFDQLGALADTLAQRVLGQGVVGGLSEAENGEMSSLACNWVGNPIELSSTSEFARLICDDILGMDPLPGQYVNLKPKLPKSWGKVTWEFNRGGGRIFVTRQTDLIWQITQSGIRPSLNIGLEVFPEPEQRATASFRLYPQEIMEINFVLNNEGYWTARLKRSKS
ncbi:MAG: hypothetical protein V2A61_07410, partial [Calditrichota bacterium]